MERIRYNQNNEELKDEFTLEAIDFLKGRMKPEKAQKFSDEFLDDPQKLNLFLDIKKSFDIIKKVGQEYKEEMIVDDLLKNIYGITREEED